MHDLLLSVGTLLLLGAGAATGRLLLKVLPVHHRSAEALAFTRTISALLVTFVALVLSLLLTSMNDGFQQAGSDVRLFGAIAVELNADLLALGVPGDPARRMLRQYLTGAIASTWSEEPLPAGAEPMPPSDPSFDDPKLGGLLNGAAVSLRRLDLPDAGQARLRDACLTQLDAMIAKRWKLIEEAHSSVSLPLLAIALFWLFMVFVSFGMEAPPTATGVMLLLLVSLSVTGVVFVILELSGPLDGLAKVSSAPLRHALHRLDGDVAAP